jgi:6-phosphofructo-2-kinase
MSKLTLPPQEHAQHHLDLSTSEPTRSASALPAIPTSKPAPKSVQLVKDFASHYGELKPLPLNTVHYNHHGLSTAKDGVGNALSDTPMPSHPGSPREYVEAAEFIFAC